MANYYDWNQAIYQYITAGLPTGSRVFLSIDDETLVDAGRLLDPTPPRSERVADFLRAVRARYVVRNKVHNIYPLGSETNKVPGYLSFLAATVLAAYRMGEDEDISQTNYFTRLKEVLGFFGDKRRPEGFEAGVEDRLWQHWAIWLTYHSYLPSAEAGEGSQKYISYPISQALLRQADRESLWRHYTERRWSRNLDESVVVARVLRDKQYLSTHLNKLFSDQTMRLARRQGLHQAIYELYDRWTNSGAGGDYRTVVSTGQVRNLVAGLYRTFNHIYGTPEYAIFPQQARRLQVEHAQVTYNNCTYDLIPERSGWYQPLWDISATELTYGLKIKIEGTEELDKLVLPTRDFWILTPDPDDPESGIYASWDKPRLGLPFIILCKQSLQPQLEQLKSQELINWRNDPLPVWDNEPWLEYEGVMVVAEGWGGVFLDNDDLRESLQPGATLGVSLSGGLRVGQSGWLVGYGPAVIIHAFDSQADLTLLDPFSNQELVIQKELKTRERFNLNWPSKAGSYRLYVSAGVEEVERFVTLLDWDSLTPIALDNYPQVSIAAGVISGALIEGKNE